MQDIVLNVCALFVVCWVFAQPLGLFFRLLGKTRSREHHSGPYRKAPEGMLGDMAAQVRKLEQLREADLERIRTLEAELEDARDVDRKKDELVEDLWYRAHGVPHPNRPLGLTMSPGRLATLLSLVAATGLVAGAIGMLPTRSVPEPRFNSRPTMLATQITWGGEVTALESRPWGWQCHSDHPTLLAIGSRIVPLNCHLPVPEFSPPFLREAGERSWVLWTFPERQGPASLAYVLN